jgi:hypothetical protein
MAKAMSTGKGASGLSMLPAAIQPEQHAKAHHIGVAFAKAHGRSHEGMTGGSTAPGGTPGPENVQGAGCMDSFEN